MPDLPPVARELLSRLLDRFERLHRRTVARVRLKEVKGYASAPRADIHAALTPLAAQNVVKLRWVKHEENNWLEAVDLIPERVDTLYALLRRASRQDRQAALRRLLAAHVPRDGWHAAFLQWAAQQLEAHRSVAPLDLADPQTSADLLKASAAIADLQTPTLERMLSVQVFGDSKRLEALRGKVIAVLRRHSAVKAALIDDDEAVLRAHLLERAPEYVPCAGPLVLCAGASEIDVGTFTPSVALSAVMLRLAHVVRVPAQQVVTIENATSFTETAAVRPAGAFLLFTGGFASPSVIRLLQAMRAAEPALQFWHWGDLDVGGLRILAHLRQYVVTIRPLAMDAPTFERHRSLARPLKKGERESLLALRSFPPLSDCGALMDALLAAGAKLEQEAVRPLEALAQLR